jgi:hypothetical protein
MSHDKLNRQEVSQLLDSAVADIEKVQSVLLNRIADLARSLPDIPELEEEEFEDPFPELKEFNSSAYEFMRMFSHWKIDYILANNPGRVAESHRSFPHLKASYMRFWRIASGLSGGEMGSTTISPKGSDRSFDSFGAHLMNEVRYILETGIRKSMINARAKPHEPRRVRLEADFKDSISKMVDALLQFEMAYRYQPGSHGVHRGDMSILDPFARNMRLVEWHLANERSNVMGAQEPPRRNAG